MSDAPELKATLTLPETKFPMKANLPQNEPARLKQWKDTDLYGQIRAARKGAEKYILHYGPPYANGPIHLGHALQKCIKDFIIKSKTMAGYDAPLVPGWDCHGLPIEIKVDEKLGRKKLEVIESAHGTLPFAVVSGSTRESVTASLNVLHLLDRFATLVCAGDYTRSKPDPEGFLMAAERLGVAPHKCLVFEDTAMGIAGATAAGMASVRVPSPFERRNGTGAGSTA